MHSLKQKHYPKKTETIEKEKRQISHGITVTPA